MLNNIQCKLRPLLDLKFLWKFYVFSWLWEYGFLWNYEGRWYCWNRQNVNVDTLEEINIPAIKAHLKCEVFFSFFFQFYGQ